MTHTCTGCGEAKEVTRENWHFINGHRGYKMCRPCKVEQRRDNYDPVMRRATVERRMERDPQFNQRRHLKAKYGLSLDDYEAMVEAQDGLCAICGQSPSGVRHGLDRRLDVDHDHETGEIRALLCSRCNLVLGHLEDDPELTKRVMDYLTQWGQV